MAAGNAHKIITDTVTAWDLQQSHGEQLNDADPISAQTNHTRYNLGEDKLFPLYP